MNELKHRDDSPSKDTHYYYETPNHKYSVVNIGKMMETFPKIKEMKEIGMFMGWESIEIKDEDLISDPIRADTWEELKDILDRYETNQI